MLLQDLQLGFGLQPVGTRLGSSSRNSLEGAALP
jgi:hypothetical protein